MNSMATSFYKLHYNETIAPHFTLDEKQDMAQRISELALQQPIWLDKDADWVGDFPELAPYVSTTLSGLYLCAILAAIVDELGQLSAKFWKSGYTELVHRIKEECGAWAIVECQRFSIPGHHATKEAGKLCDRCFPPAKEKGA